MNGIEWLSKLDDALDRTFDNEGGKNNNPKRISLRGDHLEAFNNEPETAKLSNNGNAATTSTTSAPDLSSQQGEGGFATFSRLKDISFSFSNPIINSPTLSLAKLNEKKEEHETEEGWVDDNDTLSTNSYGHERDSLQSVGFDEIDLNGDHQYSKDNSDDDDEDDEDDDDLQITTSPPISWNPDDYTPYDQTINCHGILHVRMHKVKYVPCFQHSSLHAVLALKPWKGTIKTKKVISKRCKRSPSFDDDQCFFSNMEWKDDSKTSKFLHPYNNEDTPLPTLTIDIILTTLHVIETKLCTFNIPVLPLMVSHGTWHIGWFHADFQIDPINVSLDESLPFQNHDDYNLHTTPTTSADASYSNEKIRNYPEGDKNGSPSPKLLMELCFQPSHDEDYEINESVSSEVSDKKPVIVTTSACSATASVENCDPIINEQSADLNSDVEKPIEEHEITDISSNQDGCEKNKLQDHTLRSSSPTCLLLPPNEDTDGSNSNTETISITSSSINNTSVSNTISTTTTKTAQHVTGSLNTTTKSHLFRIKPNWSVSYCAVCSTLLTPKVVFWGKQQHHQQGYRCEHSNCKLDVCGDCQLQANVRFPCSSAYTQKFVSNTFINKIESVNIMSIVAPDSRFDFQSKLRLRGVEDVEKKTDSATTTNSLDNLVVASGSQAPLPEANMSSFYGDSSETDIKEIQTDKQKLNGNEENVEGIGLLHIHISKACLFEKKYPLESSINDLASKTVSTKYRQGDYYIRIRTSNKQNNNSIRTPTVYQTSKPIFEQKMQPIVVSDYGMEFRIDVIDAITDKSVGMAVLSTQAILQRQRDWLMNQDHVDQNILFDLRRKIVTNDDAFTLELKTGAKNGFGLDFFNNSDGISGWMDLSIKFEEHPDLFALDEPRSCASRPPPDFNMELMQLHIARITAIIEDLKKFAGNVQYLVSWEDPALTGLAMILFVFTCIRFNAEYVASLPILFQVIMMIHLWSRRRSGKFEMRWIEKERDRQINAQKQLARSSTIHRPCAKIKAMVTKGRNLRSRELGLPGSLIVSVTYDPLRLLNEEQKKVASDLDITSSFPHHLGTTVHSGISTSPTWEKRNESEESRRMKQLLSQTHIFADENVLDVVYRQWVDELEFTLPILQSITSSAGDVELVPWENSPGALIFQVRFDQLFNKLPVFDNVLGEVSIPIASLVKSQGTSGQKFYVEGWFHVTEAGINESARIRDNLHNPTKKGYDDAVETNETPPAIYLRAELTLPKNSLSVSEVQKEASMVVAEEMIRSNNMTKEAKVSVIGSSLNTLNTMRGLGGNLQGIQNQLGDILDIIERIRNALNWASPQQSMITFIFIFMLWFVLFSIPLRIIILCGGLGVFVGNLLKKIGSKTKQSDMLVQNDKPAALSVLINNFIQSIPNDEDLRRVYFWKSRRVGEIERKKQANTKRSSRLKILWSARWFGEIKMKVESTKSTDWIWEECYAVIHGHRFLWWHNDKSFDEGDEPIGNIIFAGHSGLATLSPLEMRELQKFEVQFVVNIFGRSRDGQRKISLLLPNKDAKDAIENAVIHATTDAKND